MRTVLMTGADGTIGSHLKKYLESKGYNVVSFRGDVCHRPNWDQYKFIDYLIHLAAFAGVRASLADPDTYFDNNVGGMANVVDWAQCHPTTKVLYASSSNAKEWWANPYAVTKKINELQAQALTHSVGMRFHTVWPGRDDMLYRMLEQKRVDYINGQHYRDFIHVEDLCSAIETIMINFDRVDRVVDIGTGQSVAVTDLANKFGFTGEVRTIPTPYERTKTQADVAYLHELGWTPTWNVLE